MATRASSWVRPRPVCADHPGSHVCLNGTYGRGDRKRQRFRCFPTDGERPHVITEPLPRVIASHDECWECERPLAAHEGPPTPRGFEFTVREIAEALILLGRGETYRGTGAAIRELTGRNGSRTRRYDGSNIADWVELFAPAVFERYRLREWPQIVALDALPFNVSGTALNEYGHPIQGGSRAFYVFGAMGYFPRPTGVAVKLVGLQAFPGFEFRQGRPFWVEFLRSLTDPTGRYGLTGAPRQFVCDGDPDIEAAIREVWPQETPEVFQCHYHLRKHILDILRQAHVHAEAPLYEAAKHAFENSERWLAFEALAQERMAAERGPQGNRPLSSLRTWLRSNGERAAWQIAHHGGHVTDTTAIDQFFAELRGKLALRRGTFRNRERLNRLLMLVMLEQRARYIRRSDYTRVIDEQLLANDGHAEARRQIDNPWGNSTLRPSWHPRRHEPPDEPPSSLADEEDIPF